MTLKMKGCISLQETLIKLDITRKTLYNWRKAGLLEAIVPGDRQLFFRIKDVDALWDRTWNKNGR